MPKRLFKNPNRLVQWLLIPAVLLTLLNILLYEVTIIQLELIIGLYLFSLLLAFLYSQWSRKKQVEMLELCLSMTVIMGAFLTFSLLGINYLFSQQEEKTHVFKIKEQFPVQQMNLEASEMNDIAYAEVAKGHYKRLLIQQRNIQSHKTVDSIRFKLSKGFLNFHIIRKMHI